MTINFEHNYVRRGPNGIELEPTASSGPGMVSDSLTSLYTTRGTIDLNANRLPDTNDCTVRPSDPILLYDAFVVSAAGTVFTGVGGVQSLNVGDLMVLMVDGVTTTAGNWSGVVNSALPLPPTAANSSAYNGQNQWVRVVNQKLPFFPALTVALLLSASLIGHVLCLNVGLPLLS